MDIRKSQQYNFGIEALPILFHSQTNTFMNYLEKDGIKFLKFWWNHVGDRMPENKRVSFGGITYEVEKLDQKTSLITITMMSPTEDGDPYFLSFVARPERRFFLVRIPTSIGFALVRDDKCGHENLTRFGYLTPMGMFRPRGVGLKPTKADFKRQVISKISKKGRRKKLWNFHLE